MAKVFIAVLGLLLLIDHETWLFASRLNALTIQFLVPNTAEQLVDQHSSTIKQLQRISIV